MDLRASWTTFVTASDGAESFGYGWARAPCATSIVRSLASTSRLPGHAFVPSDRLDADRDYGDQLVPVRMLVAFGHDV